MAPKCSTKEEEVKPDQCDEGYLDILPQIHFIQNGLVEGYDTPHLQIQKTKILWLSPKIFS